MRYLNCRSLILKIQKRHFLQHPWWLELHKRTMISTPENKIKAGQYFAMYLLFKPKVHELYRLKHSTKYMWKIGMEENGWAEYIVFLDTSLFLFTAPLNLTYLHRVGEKSLNQSMTVEIKKKKSMAWEIFRYLLEHCNTSLNLYKERRRNIC